MQQTVTCFYSSSYLALDPLLLLLVSESGESKCASPACTSRRSARLADSDSTETSDLVDLDSMAALMAHQMLEEEAARIKEGAKKNQDRKKEADLYCSKIEDLQVRELCRHYAMEAKQSGNLWKYRKKAKEQVAAYAKHAMEHVIRKQYFKLLVSASEVTGKRVLIAGDDGHYLHAKELTPSAARRYQKQIDELRYVYMRLTEETLPGDPYPTVTGVCEQTGLIFGINARTERNWMIGFEDSGGLLRLSK